MAKDTSNNNSSQNLTMEELLASQSAQNKLVTLHRGQEVEGEIVSITDREITLDLGAKSEGVLATRGIPNLKDLKVGSKLKAFVYMQENESGQTVLSLQKQAAYLEGVRAHLRGGPSRGGKFRGGSFRGGKSIDWFKFIQAKNQKSKFQGTVAEINKGGLIVEVGGARGFLPNSQVGFELLSKSGEGPLRQSDSEASMESLIGQDLTVTVIEVDADNNKLIFSERGQVSDETMGKLKTFKTGQKVKGKIKAILPFGLIIDVAGLEGLVFISDVSWDKVDDLSKDFTVGQEPEVLVLGLDEELGRLNLSIKQLSEDPFAKIAENYPVDEVVKGEVIEVNEAGVIVKIKDEIEGFLPVSKIGSSVYEVGKTVTFLVDSLDTQRRRINLAPFVTSTEGLIYK